MSPEAFLFWVSQLRELDRSARAKELACLSAERLAAQFPGLAAPSPVEGAVRETEARAEELLRHHLQDIPAFQRELSKLQVPDDYQLWRRLVGLFPLFYIPVWFGVERVEDRIFASFQREPQDLLREGTWDSRKPDLSEPALSQAEMEDLMARRSENPLHVPLLPPAEAQRVAETLAPVFIQEQRGSHDQWGEIRRQGREIEVDGLAPSVYFYLDHGILQGIRFLDGVTVALSLDRKGRPFMAQVMNNCGCYHVFLPISGVKAIPRPSLSFPDAMVPASLPRSLSGQRLGVFLSSGRHQVVQVRPVAEDEVAGTYGLRPYELLESLPGPDGSRRSIFDASGLVPGTERPERFLFFSLGIPATGSMRQRGHHAITFLGRQHFDDPFLLERVFSLELPP
jgi:hypothetical protein